MLREFLGNDLETHRIFWRVFGGSVGSGLGILGECVRGAFVECFGDCSVLTEGSGASMGVIIFRSNLNTR